MDFKKIRNHDGSQDNGFEELICQLAHLNPPDNAEYFVRKEGAGGDAGVECYWKLRDGSEHAWQAKYFTDIIDSSQWKQISDSVEAALNKHPNITKYYVCLPRDWTDSRKIVNGRSVNSAWDKWEQHVERWKALATEKGMTIEFTYWCKHEISQMLQTDNPLFAGRALYWFQEPIIHSGLLKSIADKSRESLGERFTPELHLDLPIESQLEGLGLTKEWKTRLEVQRAALSELKNQINSSFYNNKLLKDIELWNDLCEKVNNLCDQFIKHFTQNTFLANVENLLHLYSLSLEQENVCSNLLLTQRMNTTVEKEKNALASLSRKLNKCSNILDEFEQFLKSKTVAAAVSKAAVLLGDAGIGKSHLLCDISLKRLAAFLPTLFLLGQHYSGGNPVDLILNSLDMENIPYRQVLGALDAAGEARKTRTLIVIDAINEGRYNDEWYYNISAFLSEVTNYPNLAVIFSCRTTYADYIIPADITENRLTRLYHFGFRGYEHRAASKYLSKQGISKPSAPVISPEFTNPLFLKTCCKALKENGLTSFPKGLNGISQLFSFYLNSVQKNINRKKKYLPNEKVVFNALDGFIKELYPDQLSGIPIQQARTIIDSFDPKPQIEESLTDILIHEGILSLDIAPDYAGNSRGREVIRFTYERFSDHFVAQYILDTHVVDNDIRSIFSDNQILDRMLKDRNLYRFGGIIEALGICIPERFGCEFMDFISPDSIYYDWLFERTFKKVILWRAPESINEDTIKLLNRVTSYGYYNEAIDILLSLSTEPEHPWNAEFLDKNLQRKQLAERDSFWSTHIAVSDWNEDDEQGESILRTLIDWSLFEDLSEVEMERLRLAAITLTWCTTTTNRLVRDQATKSLARIMAYAPLLIKDILDKFQKNDDLYLLERLYAAIYGTVCHIENQRIIKEVAESVYKLFFNEGKPYPHILLRDYSRGIIEIAFSKGLLSKEISPEKFRPPYNSDWPIENPTIDEIDKLGGDKYSSIKNSVLGFVGDFGIYTMRCIHDWSSTSITETEPESSIEVQKKFASSLPEELKDRYLKHLDRELYSRKNSSFNFEKFLKEFDYEDIDEVDYEELDEVAIPDSESTWENLKEQIEEVLDSEQKEYFRWVRGLGISDRPASFSRKWAQRWVCKRAYELGWEDELFEEFERTHTRNHNRNRPFIERVGKKYQWIAFYELLAMLSDNLLWIDRGYSDVDDSIFMGPWQIHLRDIDPTLWLRNTGDSGGENWDVPFWWQPFVFPFVDGGLEEQNIWLWDQSIIPPFRELFERTNPLDNEKWLVLRGYSSWHKKTNQDEDDNPTPNGWYRINSCIVQKDDFDKLKENLQGKNLCDPDLISPRSTDQVFLKEYPWHPSCKEFTEWVEPDMEWRDEINIRHIVPVSEYRWSSGSNDRSIDESISLYLPSKLLISDLGLKLAPFEFGFWTVNESLAFMDPSSKEKGPSYALIRSDLFNSWLEEKNLKLVWLVGGEKQLFSSNADKFYGRLVYSGIFTNTNEEIEGDIWFIEEKGRE